MAYTTYDELMRRAQEENQYWSDYDRELARRDPDAGLSIYTAKKNYATATNEQERQTANNQANAIRKQYGGYTAGKTGADYMKDDTYFVYDDPYADRLNDALDKILGYGEFDNPYQGEIDDLVGKISSRPDFSYDPNTDPIYQNYRETYLREGNRAREDTLGSVAAMTGGMPSTAATAAAEQAQNYYNAQLADVIPSLYQQAFDMYITNANQNISDLSAIRGAANDALNYWNANLALAQNQYGALSDISDRFYGRAADKWGMDYQVGRDQMSDAQWQREYNLAAQQSARDFLEQMIAAGQQPTHEMIVAAGLNDTDVKNLTDFYKQQYMMQMGGSSGGSSRSSSGSSRSSGSSKKTSSKSSEDEYISDWEANNANTSGDTPSYKREDLPGFGSNLGYLTQAEIDEQLQAFIARNPDATQEEIKAELARLVFSRG